MTKLSVVNAVAVSLVIAGLAGCGGGDKGDPQDSTAPSSSTAATPQTEQGENPEAAAEPVDSAEPLDIASSFNTWLSDGYANGLGTAWEAPGASLGTSSDRTKVLFAPYEEGAEDPFGIPTIHNVADGKVLKSLDDVKCSIFGSGHSLDGTVYCWVPGDSEETFDVVAVDLDTMEPEVVLNGKGTVKRVDMLAAKGDVHYLGLVTDTATTVLAFNAKEPSLEWAMDGLMGEPNHCFVIAETLVCKVPASEEYFVVSLADGSLEGHFTVLPGLAGVMTDQGVVATDLTAGTGKLIRFDGTEEDIEAPFGAADLTASMSFGRTFFAHFGTVVDFESLMAKELPGEVDREGSIVVERPQPLPVTASETGKVLFGYGMAGQALTSIETKETLAKIDAMDVQFFDGLIVEGANGLDGAVKIHPPA